MSDQSMKHPPALWTLFLSEMWERFCYYGMRTLLTLFLVKSLLKGDAEASIIYGAYTALVYAAPVLGGRMADSYLGYRYAIILGAILMAIGEFLMVAGTDMFGLDAGLRESLMLIGMGGLIVGNGYFKANISTIVGKLYSDDDTRRDSGFTIFYIGINVGALLATTVVAFVGETYGFEYGFALAGLGMLLGLFIFWNGREKYNHVPNIAITEAGREKWLGMERWKTITVLSLLLIPLSYVLISKNEILQYLLIAIFVYVAYQLIAAGIKEGPVWRDRMIALVIMMIVNVVFWSFFEQAGTSLTLYADRNVSREIFGWLMPASMTQFFNPFFIVTFGSLFTWMWMKLNEIGKNPSIPMKFSLGLLQLGAGFLVTVIGYQFLDESTYAVPLLTLVFLYMLHTTGELFVSPIGLSMVTKLAPKSITGTAMGGWFLSFAMANFLAGQIAAITGSESHEEDPKNAKLTLIEALNKSNENVTFEGWNHLVFPSEENNDIPNNVDMSTYDNYQRWAVFRTAFQKEWTVAEYKAASDSMNVNYDNVSEWLRTENWVALNASLEKIIDWNSEEFSNIDYGSFLYYGNPTDLNGEESIREAYALHVKKVSQQSLDKYTGIFKSLGLVAIGIALLLGLLRNPINKLMHGVV
ncbi:peptide MFS transporter [Schleiferiaceae bacterium]|nr:peptide MFS transporter [Schleiferiaceae bacterium]MDB0057470.1 peptide MFS transporter [Schleiferiaceae bacterium]MDB2539600.1 peptide MFS transporter [Schleiferiaceae bacterium]